MKTQNRPLEIVFKRGEFSIEVNCLMTGRDRLVSQSIASYDVFEGDFWGESVAEFSHSLDPKQTSTRRNSFGQGATNSLCVDGLALLESVQLQP